MPEGSEEKKEGASVPQSPEGFTVNPSPLNAVKLELAVVLVGAVTLYALLEVLLETGWVQVALLGVFGVISFLWLVVRARQVVQRHSSAGKTSP